MAKSIKSQKARTTRLREGRSLLRQRQRTLKQEERTIRARSKQRKASAVGVKQREKGVRRVLTATGVIPTRTKGAGRPSGTYKHGMPIQQYRRAMAQQRAVFRQQRQMELIKLKRRGLSEEQINRLQLARTLSQQGRAIVPDSRRAMMQQATGIADEEKDFTRFRAEKTISPNTQRMLTQLRRVQNKGEVDRIEMDRRTYEKRLLAEQGNLLKAKNLFGADSANLDMLTMQNNILQADNVFKSNDEDNLLKQNRGNILDTSSHGNTLRF